MPNSSPDVDRDQIEVSVRFFAAPREALGEDQIKLKIPKGTTVAGLLEILKQEYPALKSYMRFLSVAVNRAYVGMGTHLEDGDVVACLPPVGGGGSDAI